MCTPVNDAVYRANCLLNLLRSQLTQPVENHDGLHLSKEDQAGLDLVFEQIGEYMATCSKTDL